MLSRAELALEEQQQERRRQRLVQVREQEARIAAQLRQQFRADQQQAVAVRQRDQAAVWQQEHEQEKNSLVDRYKSCIASFGEAHQAAARLQEDGWRHAAAEQEAAERERLVADQRYQHALREVMQHKSATHGEQEQRRQQLARARELAAQQMSDFVAREQQRQALQAQPGPADVPMVSVARHGVRTYASTHFHRAAPLAVHAPVVEQHRAAAAASSALSAAQQMQQAQQSTAAAQRDKAQRDKENAERRGQQAARQVFLEQQRSELEQNLHERMRADAAVKKHLLSRANGRVVNSRETSFQEAVKQEKLEKTFEQVYLSSIEFEDPAAAASVPMFQVAADSTDDDDDDNENEEQQDNVQARAPVRAEHQPAPARNDGAARLFSSRFHTHATEAPAKTSKPTARNPVPAPAQNTVAAPPAMPASRPLVMPTAPVAAPRALPPDPSEAAWADLELSMEQPMPSSMSQPPPMPSSMSQPPIPISSHHVPDGQHVRQHNLLAEQEENAALLSELTNEEYLDVAPSPKRVPRAAMPDPASHADSASILARLQATIQRQKLASRQLMQQVHEQDQPQQQAQQQQQQPQQQPPPPPPPQQQQHVPEQNVQEAVHQQPSSSSSPSSPSFMAGPMKGQEPYSALDTQWEALLFDGVGGRANPAENANEAEHHVASNNMPQRVEAVPRVERWQQPADEPATPVLEHSLPMAQHDAEEDRELDRHAPFAPLEYSAPDHALPVMPQRPPAFTPLPASRPTTAALGAEDERPSSARSQPPQPMSISPPSRLLEFMERLENLKTVIDLLPTADSKPATSDSKSSASDSKKPFKPTVAFRVPSEHAPGLMYPPAQMHDLSGPAPPSVSPTALEVLQQTGLYRGHPPIVRAFKPSLTSPVDDHPAPMAWQPPFVQADAEADEANLLNLLPGWQPELSGKTQAGDTTVERSLQAAFRKHKQSFIRRVEARSSDGKPLEHQEALPTRLSPKKNKKKKQQHGSRQRSAPKSTLVSTAAATAAAAAKKPRAVSANSRVATERNYQALCAEAQERERRQQRLAAMVANRVKAKEFAQRLREFQRPAAEEKRERK